MEHRRADKVEWEDAPAENFTGRARFGPLSDHGPLNVLAVRFEATARTDWHSHPEGQVLYVVAGRGRIQDDDGTTVEFGAGDTLYTPPGQIHWHGAGPDGPMTHLSLTTGGATIWEPRKVTDKEYNRNTPIHIPRTKGLRFTILQALGAMGGEGQAKEVVGMVGRLHGVTEEQWTPKTKTGTSKLDTKIRWAATDLKDIGCLVKGGGIWRLTSKGEEYLRRSQEETRRDLNDELSKLAREYQEKREDKETIVGESA